MCYSLNRRYQSILGSNDSGDHGLEYIFGECGDHRYPTTTYPLPSKHLILSVDRINSRDIALVLLGESLLDVFIPPGIFHVGETKLLKR